MSDERSGRELTPRELGLEGSDSAITPVPEADSRAVERFSAGPKAHTVGLTEERTAQIVRQSGNARNLVFLSVLVISLFIPVYWFYENGIPAVGAEGRLEREADVQYVTDVERGYELYQANCAECHGEQGQGGVGPPLNDQTKLYNALTADGDPGTGHLNPNYINTVLTVGGRYVCGDPNSVMQAWREPNGPLNYRQVEELIAWITASDDIVFEYDPAAHGAAASPAADMADPAAHEGAVTVRGWRDPDWTPAPGSSPPPACWRPYENEAFASSATPPPVEPITPGTADAPRVIQIKATSSLSFTDAEGSQLGQIAVLPGETVQFEIENQAGFDHNFYIGTDDQLSVPNATTDVGIPNWTEGIQTITWTVPEGDGLRFGCTVPGHYSTMNGDIAFQEAVAVDSTDGDDAEAAGDAGAPAAAVAADATPGPTPEPTGETEA
jgi:mono/diheme cytochrome c family protein